MKKWPVVGVAVALLVCTSSGAFAQAQATVQGRVIAREGASPVSGVAVELTGHGATLTDPEGRFRFQRVPVGRYALAVSAIGFTRDERTLVLDRDTTILIVLDHAPVRLDSLVVEARSITIRGTVTDRALAVGLIDVDVYTSLGHQDRTDPLGRFKLRGIPAYVPVTFNVRELGYMPAGVTITADRDTTLQFALETDPVGAAMIEERKRRIAERAGTQRYPFDGVIDRPELLRNLDGSAWDLLERILGARARKVRCVVIDEKMVLGNWAANTPSKTARGRSNAYAPSSPLAYMLPDRLEYIDILKFGSRNDSLMIRAYSRDFIRRMTGSGEELVPLDRIKEGAHIGLCR